MKNVMPDTNKKTSRTADLQDSEKDKAKLKEEVTTIDLPEVQDIPGQIPSLLDAPPGCRFHPRCPQRMAVCETDDPTLRPTTSGRVVACHLYR